MTYFGSYYYLIYNHNELRELTGQLHFTVVYNVYYRTSGYVSK